jgi:cellulose synthase/poly-beta-1,6-N-acetylglucosamine synthase-like glycosyltransferase
VNLIALLLFAAAFTVQVAYWIVLRYGFEHAQRGDAPEPEASLPPVSAVVAARDEADHLPVLLAALTRQTHPCYEVLVVDDASTDATPEIIQAWQQAHANVRLLRLDQPQPPRKKHALAQGIEAARYDLLALTDADCAPPPGWLEVLARHHTAASEDTLLVGYSPFRKAPGLLNRLARYETFVTGFLTAAAVGLGRPYMAVGRNLSYGRDVFDRLGGFAHSSDSMSGDDDLLVQEVARCRAATVRHVFDPRAFVPSDPPAMWRQWLRQKLRHLSAGRFYDRGVQAHLALFHMTGVVLWAAPFAAGWIGAGLLVARLLVQGLALRRAAHVLGERDLLPTQPLLDLLYAAYNLLIAPLGLARMPKRW